MISRLWPTLLWITAMCAAGSAAGAEDVLLAKGTRLQADVSGSAGTWIISGDRFRVSEVLCIRFSPEPAPGNVVSGVFIRGGSLLVGTLASLVGGEDAEFSSNALGQLKLRSEDIAGAFYPLPVGKAENIPELSGYSFIAAAALGSIGATLQPGRRCQITMVSGDEISSERLSSVDRIRSETVLVTFKDKRTDPVSRAAIRLIEMQTPPPAPPTREEEALGAEIVVRLKGGDLIRGRLVKLDAKGLLLRAPCFMGEKLLPRAVLASLFLAGPGSDVSWLSAQKPVKSQHMPQFDAEFPARMDASVGRSQLNIGGLPCERGIGVHSRSVLEFALGGGASQRFFSLCGIDSETKGRGEVTARVLADGRELWNSGPLTAKNKAQLLSLELGAAKLLTLEVDFGPEGEDSGDHFDWGWASVIGK